MEGNLNTILQVLGLIIQFFNFVALILAAAAAFYYANQAKNQVEKTNELVEEAKQQTKVYGCFAEAAGDQASTTEDLVFYAGRPFEPNAVIRILDRTKALNNSKLTGLFIKRDCLCDIPVAFLSLSEGVSKFYLTLRAWFSSNSGFCFDLTDKVIGDIYTGKREYILLRSEQINDHTHLDLKPLLGNWAAACLFRLRAMPLLDAGIINLETDIKYTNKKTFRREKYFDHYYFIPGPRWVTGKELTLFVEGRWVYGGRSEKPKYPYSEK